MPGRLDSRSHRLDVLNRGPTTLDYATIIVCYRWTWFLTVTSLNMILMKRPFGTIWARSFSLMVSELDLSS